MPNEYIVGASEYSGSGHSCPKGPAAVNNMAFAELMMGSALGNLPCGTKLIMQTVGGKGATVEASKADIGLGGAPVQGHARRVDLWIPTARAMGFKGTGLIRIRRADGKRIPGLGDKEKSVGAEGTGFFGIGVGPNVAPESSETLKKAVDGLGGWASELGKILGFIDSSAGWVRIGKVVFGVGLLLLAVDELSKITPGPSTNVAAAPGKAVSGAKKAAELAAL
jgi:hypothetical protein